MGKTIRTSGRPKRAFALVLVLMLVAMLSATGTGLAMLAATETVRADYVALDLDHELAVDSLIRHLPKLLEKAPAPGKETDRRLVQMTVGPCEVKCAVQAESEKLRVRGSTGEAGPTERLRQLARANELAEEEIKLRPIHRTKETEGWPSFVWFDQLVQPQSPNGVFRRQLQDQDPFKRDSEKVWSDLLTFWQASGRLMGLEVVTSIGPDIRRWYVVVALDGAKPQALFRGAM